MDVDEYEPSMEVEQTSYQSIIDNDVLKYNSDIVCDLNSLNPNKKVLKIDSYEDFVLFQNNPGISAKSFPFLFVFTIYIHDHDHKYISMKINEKFNDSRPLIVEFRSNERAKGAEKTFIKDIQDFKEFIELDEYKVNSNIRGNIFDFPTFIGALKYNKLKAFEIRAKVLQCDNVLIARYLRIYDFHVDILVEMCCETIKNSNNDKILFAMLDLPFDFKDGISSHSKLYKSVDLMKYVSPCGLSILRTAIKTKKKKYISFILNNFAQCFDGWSFYDKLIISQKLIPIPDMLNNYLLIDFPFPGIDKDREIDKERFELHRAITSGDVQKVSDLIDENLLTKIAFDSNNQSAIMKALVSKQFEVYSLLKSRGYICGINESIERMLASLTKGNKDDITAYNTKYSQEDPKRFARNLIRKSRSHGSNLLLQENFKSLQKYFFDLNEISEVNELFEITSDFVDEIHFDFLSVDIGKMNPVHNNDAGLTCSSGIIFIGAGGSEVETKKTIVHELCHYAMEVVYENDFKPYYKFNQEKEAEFKNILKDVQKIKFHAGDDVKKVFTYDESEFEKELIVTVPVMVFQSKDDINQLNGYQAPYKLLFDYYKKVSQALKKFDPERRKDLKELNKDFGVLKKCWLKFENHTFEVQETQVLTTKIPKMTLSSVYQQLFEKYGTLVEKLFLFIDVKVILEDPEIAKKCLKIIETYEDVRMIVNFPENLDKILKEISFKFTSFDTLQAKEFSPLFQFGQSCTNPSPELLKSKLFDKLFSSSNNNFTVVTPSEDICIYLRQKSIPFTHVGVTSYWKDLKIDTQEKILTKMVEFQNKEIKLSQIVKHQHAQHVFNENFLAACLKEEVFCINSLPPNNDVYIPRNFFNTFAVSEVVDMREEEYRNHTDRRVSVISNTKYKLISKENEICKVKKTKIKRIKLVENEILQHSERQEFVLISNAAGSGKSRVLRKVRDYLKDEHPHNWIYLVDLKNYINDFISNQSELFVEFFVNKILKDRNELEKSIFVHSYKYSKIFLLFDGFDEISPKCKEPVLKFLKSFNGVKGSQVWITTRDYLEVDLRKELKVKNVFSLDAYTRENQIEHLVSYWRSQNTPGDLETKADTIFTLLVRVMTKDSLIGIPLQLQIIAEGTTNGGNFSNIENESKYMFDIFKRTIAKKIDIWQRERGELAIHASISANENGTSFYDLHKFLALKTYYEAKNSFCGLNLPQMWTKAEIIRCGIVRDFEGNLPIFLLETYKEFFASYFIVKGVNKLSDVLYKEFFNYFCEFLCKKEHKIVRMFLDGGFSDLFEIPEGKFEIISQILKENNVIRFVSTEGRENVLSFILKILKKMDYFEVKNILNNKFIFPKYLYGGIFHLIIDAGKTTTFKILVEFCREFLLPKDFKSLILSVACPNNRTILHIASFQSQDVFRSVLMDLEQTLDAELMKEILVKKTAYGETTLHLLSLTSFLKLKLYWENLTKYLSSDELIEFANRVVCGDMNVFTIAISKQNIKGFEFLMTKIQPKIEIFKLKQRYKKRNVLQLVAFAKNLEFHKMFWKCMRKNFSKDELKELISEPDENGNNFLHILVAFADKDILTHTLRQLEKIFVDKNELKKLLTIKGFRDRNLITKAVDYFKTVKPDDQIVLWQFLRKVFGDDFKIFLDDRDTYNDNILHTIASFSTTEILKSFIEFLESFMSENEIKYYLGLGGRYDQNLRQRAIFNGSIGLHDLMDKLAEKYQVNVSLYRAVELPM